MSAFIEKAGLLDTVQDAGRLHWGHLGINPNGPMDWYAYALANALVGNSENTPVVELHFPASTFRFLEPAIISLTGADFGASINNISIPVNRTVKVPSGARLHFSRKIIGERAYLSVTGGWQVPSRLGSCSTNLKSKFGGFAGRKFMAGDTIPYATRTGSGNKVLQISNASATTASYSTTIRVLRGPEWSWLDSLSQSSVFENEFLLNPQSDRMAFSWQANPLQLKDPKEMVSSAVAMGTVQLLPNGQLLTLMADHQTVGGYPRILQVIKADLPSLAQLTPGTSVRFQLTDLDFSIKEWMQMKSHLQQVASAVRLQMAFG